MSKKPKERLCLKCKKPANRPMVLKKKGVHRKKEVTIETEIPNQYSCDCGLFLYFGNRKEEEIDRANKIYVDKLPE